ncbi:hypothetical protein LZQ00_04375 [Sphingobacterium sp. SRCM116780]|uniref:TQO small subunit DoxA domain-containing protein n=1 Tax=Sphingobacterium sp. SRCM116780 TaxID=2907623 RepID=UPI001F44FA71|nr:TQO small subunit DoxA domain-containing protein [Sphingobacterium sp. SRCM116780]UIR57052.1 hypothetical protein LZQ00_04375 [Sphingobacterium sp. SRCM116780]
MTLFTNQYFHGGVYGTLHNKSVQPKIEISNAQVLNNNLYLTLYRADVYGSFLIEIQILDTNNRIVQHIRSEELAALDKKNIDNFYVAKIQPGKHSLVIPLGAKAIVNFDLKHIKLKKNGDYQVKLIDISGLEWIEKLQIN